MSACAPHLLAHPTLPLPAPTLMSGPACQLVVAMAEYDDELWWQSQWWSVDVVLVVAMTMMV